MIYINMKPNQNHQFSARRYLGKHPPQRGGFTILEMLVVVSVIALLASILLPALSSALKKAKIAKTQTIIDALNSALKQYRSEFGAYPPHNSIPLGEVITSAECLYYYAGATFIAGANSQSLSAGPYMDFRGRDLSSTGRTADVDGLGADDDALYEIVDSWGNALQYEQPGTNNTTTFDIYSYGPNGTDNSGGDPDDIKNWY